jgi:pullulanase
MHFRNYLFSISYIISIFFFLTSCGTTERVPSPDDEPIPVNWAAAHWVSAEHLLWDADVPAVSYDLYYSSDATITVYDRFVYGGKPIPMEPGGEIDPELADKLRHIARRQVFTIDDERERIHEALQGQLVAVAKNEAGYPVAATHVQRHGVLDDLFYYDGTLGPVYHENGIGLYVWAPTAQSVTLSLFDSEKNKLEEISPIQAAPSDGVWRFEGPAEWDRLFYRFNVDVYHRQTDRVHRFEVTDPYSVSLATDSEYSQFVDLANDDSLKPEGWDGLIKELPFPTDITLYEAHVRDFSIIDESIPEEHRGTYMAFTHNGENGRSLSDGMRHLKALADAGLTHLHLLPVNDIASIIEDRSKRVDLDDPYNLLCERLGIDGLQDICERYGDTPIRNVFEQWADDDPITEKIQHTYSEEWPGSHFARYDGFNWGYDPFHFNAPEGSYSTDPDGPQRILELREMVQSLDEIGLNIVVDVVYNHTHATGDHRHSVLDKVVPDYYHRLNPDTGEVENSTCCPNTAAEFRMMEKLIIDSVILWAKHYKIDSFRFDLMGHHPKYVMENLLEALAELTPEEHGVDGKNIYIYGEGWNFGEVADNRIFDQATQFMTGGTGIGNFNDRSRDAIRGGFFSWTGREQGFASGRYLFPNEEAGTNRDEEREALLSQADRIRVGMTGNLSTYPYINRAGERVDGGNEWIGYALLPQEAVNYIDKHDNETLWDNTQAKLPFDLGMDERVRIHMLSNAFITYGQGVPFYQLGTDILRSKSMDRNSYDSGDWYNAVDYTLETHLWGSGLPPKWDNEDRWDEHRQFMTNENISVEKHHMEFANAVFRDQLRVRYSSPLFRLRTADQVHRRVAFHNTGPEQKPGIIAMTISDGICAGESLDPNYDGILVVFNADLEPKSVELNLSGMKLHPILENGSDPVITETEITNGVYLIPALSAAVFVKPMANDQGEFVCNEVD